MKYLLMALVAIVVGFIINKWLGIAILIAACAYMIYSYIPAIHASQGNKAFQEGDLETALEKYKKAYDTGRADVMIRASYAYVLLKNGMPEDAEGILNGILANKRIPKEKKYVIKMYRCMVFQKLDRLDEAIEDAEELFEEYKNSHMYGLLGYFKILNNDPLDEVLKFCLEAYEFNSDDRDILDNLSIVYYKLGEYEKAKEISDKLISMAPKFVEAFYHGAQISYKNNENDKAREYLEKINDCVRSYMTTVSEDEISELTGLVNKGEN